jgi:hypothetical protein
MKKLGDLHVTTSVLRLAVHDETPGLEREHLYAVTSLFVLKRWSDVVGTFLYVFPPGHSSKLRGLLRVSEADDTSL